MEDCFCDFIQVLHCILESAMEDVFQEEVLQFLFSDEDFYGWVRRVVADGVVPIILRIEIEHRHNIILELKTFFSFSADIFVSSIVSL